jgi:uncharacterized cysteine cluster protein YcgN (CxxCxxCC family)
VPSYAYIYIYIYTQITVLKCYKECIKTTVTKKDHVRWVPVTTAWRVLGLRMEEQPPAVEGSCEYIEKAAAVKRQGVVIQHGGYEWG